MTLPSPLVILPADPFPHLAVEFPEPGGEGFGLAAAGGFGAVFAVVGGLVCLGVVTVVVLVVVNAARLRRKGIDPLASEAEIVADALRATPSGTGPSGTGQGAGATAPSPPSRSIADRLAQVDRLHAEGGITDAEREAQRTRILDEV
ncbi:hypothetical protein [Myceligenerans indicum]|uniref:SHOCT domain-containing protein n=1 Tax=Myceligenerans indicum TaxID=2593663 RepID=A0ABS1LQL8_9MICO|nr:hypothetical protein [Myceligenerans indicum]MBL0888567.1 SHOCT domain-containing protein [Myceligenerans indicum]